MTQYTISDVKKHNGRNGSRTWIVYRGEVFDVTDFIPEHPGGADAIREEAGTDVTKVFDEIGHDASAKKDMQKYKIGVLIPEEKLKTFTLNEVSVNNGRNGNRLWTIYKNEVYDLTDFVNEHPGGAAALQDSAGRDGTRDFDEAGHDSGAIKQLKSYKIGALAEADRKVKRRNTLQGSVAEAVKQSRSFLSIITCGLVG